MLKAPEYQGLSNLAHILLLYMPVTVENAAANINYLKEDTHVRL